MMESEHVHSPGKAVSAKVSGMAVPAKRPSRYQVAVRLRWACRAGTPPPFLGTRRADFDNVQAGDDPYVRQAMATLKEGESHDRFFEVLDSISEKKAAKGNAALIEAVGVGRACSSVHMRVCKKVSTCVRR